MWCTCRVENILTLGKLLSLWFCFLLHSILFLISQTSYRTYKIISSYELACPVMGTIFLVTCTMFIILQNIYRLCKFHTTCSALEFLSFTYIFLVIIYLLSLLLLTDCCSGRVFLPHYGASARPGHRHLQLLHRKLHGRRPAMQSKTLTVNTTPTPIGHTL